MGQPAIAAQQVDPQQQSNLELQQEQISNDKQSDILKMYGNSNGQVSSNSDSYVQKDNSAIIPLNNMMNMTPPPPLPDYNMIYIIIFIIFFGIMSLIGMSMSGFIIYKNYKP